MRNVELGPLPARRGGLRLEIAERGLPTGQATATDASRGLPFGRLGATAGRANHESRTTKKLYGRTKPFRRKDMESIVLHAVLPQLEYRVSRVGEHIEDVPLLLSSAGANRESGRCSRATAHSSTRDLLTFRRSAWAESPRLGGKEEWMTIHNR